MHRRVRQSIFVLMSALIAFGTPLSHSNPSDSKAPCEASMNDGGAASGDCCGDPNVGKCASACALAAAGTVIAINSELRVRTSPSRGSVAQPLDIPFKSRAGPPGLQPPR
jgi:hypothetical protein